MHKIWDSESMVAKRGYSEGMLRVSRFVLSIVMLCFPELLLEDLQLTDGVFVHLATESTDRFLPCVGVVLMFTDFVL